MWSWAGKRLLIKLLLFNYADRKGMAHIEEREREMYQCAPSSSYQMTKPQWIAKGVRCHGNLKMSCREELRNGKW